jgi:hypothetical protein
MTENEFKLLATAFDRVVIFNPGRDVSSRWEVWAYQKDNPWLRNRLRSARQDARTFASVDSALSFIRKSGYMGIVEIDQPQTYSLLRADADDESTAGPQ